MMSLKDIRAWIIGTKMRSSSIQGNRGLICGIRFTCTSRSELMLLLLNLKVRFLNFIHIYLIIKVHKT